MCPECGNDLVDGACATCFIQSEEILVHGWGHAWAEQPETCDICASEAAETEMNQ